MSAGQIDAFAVVFPPGGPGIATFLFVGFILAPGRLRSRLAGQLTQHILDLPDLLVRGHRQQIDQHRHRLTFAILDQRQRDTKTYGRSLVPQQFADGDESFLAAALHQRFGGGGAKPRRRLGQRTHQSGIELALPNRQPGERFLDLVAAVVLLGEGQIGQQRLGGAFGLAQRQQTHGHARQGTRRLALDAFDQLTSAVRYLQILAHHRFAQLRHGDTAQTKQFLENSFARREFVVAELADELLDVLPHLGRQRVFADEAEQRFAVAVAPPRFPGVAEDVAGDAVVAAELSDRRPTRRRVWSETPRRVGGRSAGNSASRSMRMGMAPASLASARFSAALARLLGERLLELLMRIR